jgi:uncharacterized protein
VADISAPDGAVPLISVRGSVTLEVDPEIAEIAVQVAARDKDRERTLRRLSDRQRAVRAVLESFGDAVDKLETAGLRVRPELHGKRAGEKVTGYLGTVRTTVTVSDFTVLGDLVMRVGDEDMTSVDGPWWSLRTDSPVYTRARQEAVRDALTRAREYAAAVGCRLTGLRELADTGLTTGVRGGDMAAYGSMALAAGSAAPGGGPPPLDLDPATQHVSAQVEARFTATPPALD